MRITKGMTYKWSAILIAMVLIILSAISLSTDAIFRYRNAYSIEKMEKGQRLLQKTEREIEKMTSRMLDIRARTEETYKAMLITRKRHTRQHEIGMLDSGDITTK